MKPTNKLYSRLSSFFSPSFFKKRGIILLLCGFLSLGATYNILTTPSNDLCSTAVTLGPLDYQGSDSVTGTTLAATTTGAPIDCGTGVDNSESGGVWYTFTGTGNRFYEISTCDPGTTIDTEVSVYYGYNDLCNNLVCVDGNDDDGSCTQGNGSSNSSLDVMVDDEAVSIEYFIYVKGQAGSAGDFVLHVNDLSPANNDCEEAIEISPPEGGSTNLSGTTNFATVFDYPSNCGDGIDNSDGPGVWYKFNPRTNCNYEISTCSANTNFDTEISVYRGSFCGILSCLNGNDDDVLCTAGSGSTNSTVTVNNPSSSPQPYYIYVKGNGGSTGDFELTVTETPKELLLSVKAFLEGPYDSASGLMNDDLRTQDLIPSTEPYSNNGETVDAAVLAVSGDDAIVDWVLVELRDQNINTVVYHTRAALLQRDGDIVDTDGMSPISFIYTREDIGYFVAVRHRNHLGVMATSALNLSETASSIDLSTSATTVYGTDSRVDLGSGTLGLYGADTDGSGGVNATDRSNTWNDRNQSGYLGSDCDLSGTTNATDRSATWNNRNLGGTLPN